MSKPGPLSERAVVLAPNGRDAQLAVSILREAGFPAQISPDLRALVDEITPGAGLAVIADEAVTAADMQPLLNFLQQQPAWSDFPIVLLMRRGGGPERNPAAAKLAELLGNVTFVERPFHATTLISVVRAAVRGRRRQYEARKRLQDLGEGEAQLRTALRAGQLGSWALVVGTSLLNASDSCLAHFGRNPGVPFSYDDLSQAIFPDDLFSALQTIDDTLRTGLDCAIECRIVWPDGSIHWIELRARAVKGTSGSVDQLVGVSSDITERKTSELERESLLAELANERAALSEFAGTLEERVQERTAELTMAVAAREQAQEQLLQSQKMESIGQLTGGIAHDFNNLLMAITSNLEMLRRGLPDDARTRRLIDSAIQGAQRGASLTQRMLAFARQQNLKTDSVDIVSLLIGMEELLERSLGPRIKLHIHMAERLPPVQVDAQQVELAILNLAINARDAMPEGGPIDITVDQIGGESEAKPSGNAYVRIQVADTGIGMDATTLKKAIEPYFSTKPVGKGTGLGLSMVHGLAVQLGGLLDLTSEVGKGTLATLCLPVATAPPARKTSQTADMATGRSATILVVDDDPLVAVSTVDMLEDLGHRVIGADSAVHALEILETGQNVDLLMTDHVMPGMTGIELAAIVHSKRPKLPVLLTTGYADLPPGQEIDLPRLSKPYLQAQLRKEIERLLERS